MDKVTGVVLERDGRHVVLMTPMGEFKRVRMSGKLPDIGEEVCIPVAHKRFFRMPKAGWIAVAAAVLILLVGNPLLTMVTNPPEAAMAYVSIDIKPSLELTVSDRYNVLDVEALNADGQKVLNGTSLKGVKYTEAVTKIKEKASQMGYLKDSNADTVLVSVAFLNNPKVDKELAQNTLVMAANNVFADTETKVAAVHVPTDLRESAKKKGISTGKYAVLIEAVNSGLSVTEKDMQEKQVNDAISGAGGHPQQIIDQAGQEKQFDVEEKKYFALASRNNLEPVADTVADAVYNIPGQPDVSIAATEVEAKPGTDTQPGSETTVPPKSTKGRKYVETIRKSGGPEDQRSQEQSSQVPSSNETPAVVPEQQTTQTGSEPPAVPPKDTGGTEVDGQKTFDNYMGQEQTSNTGSSDPAGLNEMYKAKPNW